MDTPKILMVIGSSREGRLGGHVGEWLRDQLKARGDMDVTYVDLQEFHLPMFGEGMNENVTKWMQMVEEADGFVLVTPEYNHSFSSVLKNAIDFAKEQWFYKPAAYASYSISPFGGVRSVEHLRAVHAELRVYGLRDGLHIPFVQNVFDEQGKLLDESMLHRVEPFAKQLVYWANALKDDREGAKKI